MYGQRLEIVMKSLSNPTLLTVASEMRESYERYLRHIEGQRYLSQYSDMKISMSLTLDKLETECILRRLLPAEEVGSDLDEEMMEAYGLAA